MASKSLLLLLLCLSIAGLVEVARAELERMPEVVPFPANYRGPSTLVDTVKNAVLDGISDVWWYVRATTEAKQERFFKAVNFLVDIPNRLKNLLVPVTTNHAASTEPLPTIVPEPPTLSYNSVQEMKMPQLFEQVMREFHADLISGDPKDSCADAVEQHSNELKQKLQTQIESNICRTNHKSLPFCKLFDVDRNLATEIVFAKFGVNPIEIAIQRMTVCRKSDLCESIFQTRRLTQRLRMKNEHHKHSLFVFGNSLRNSLRNSAVCYNHNVQDLVKSAKQQLVKLCANPSCPKLGLTCKLAKEHPGVFESVFVSGLRPWDTATSKCGAAVSDVRLPQRFHYRRAMLFGNGVQVEVVEDGEQMQMFEEATNALFHRLIRGSHFIVTSDASSAAAADADAAANANASDVNNIERAVM